PHALLFPFPVEGVDWRETDRMLAESGVVPIAALRVESVEEVGRFVDLLAASIPRSGARGAAIGAPCGPPADLAPALEAALAERGLPWAHLLVVDSSLSLLESTIALSPPLLAGLGRIVRARGIGALRSAWEILQGTRRRITRVEYISCPSCGRTLFDLEIVTARIRERTLHLKNVKIAVMGCIVNGPGEMADADFGYVGSGPGRIDLYVGANKVEKSVPESEAVERLVALIRSNGRWTEP
ncbi:MAG: hypothetical protein EHM19_02100, partial [Candidatus Latescibacterota bacterium]